MHIFIAQPMRRVTTQLTKNLKFGVKSWRWNFLIVILLLATFAQGSDGRYPIKNFTPADYRAGIQNIDFAQNRNMSIFVANNLGVLSFNGNEWETYVQNTGKKQRSLKFDERNDRLYVGSQGDFGFFEKDWEYTSLLKKIPPEAQGFDEVWDVFLFNSKVYYCTFQGIYVYNGEVVTPIQREAGFNRSFLAGNRLFTQSPSGDLFEIQDDKLSPSMFINTQNEILSGILQKDDGYLFFYSSGKIEFSNAIGASEVFPDLSKALDGKFINHVLQLSDTRLVISTQTAGLFLYDEKTNIVENIATNDGLLSNACLRAFQDYDGNLWVGMQNGIALVDINSPLRLVNQDINLQGSGYEAFETEAGTYYTTSNGVYYMPTNGTNSVFLPGTEGPAYSIQRINNKIYAGHHTGLFLLNGNNARRIASTNGLWQLKQLRTNPQYAIGGTYTGLHLFRVGSNQELTEVGKIEGFNESSRFFEEDRQGRIWVGQYYKGLYQLTLSDSYQKATVVEVSKSYDLPIKQYVILSRIDDEIYIPSEKGIYKLDQTSGEIVEDEVFADVVGKQWVYYLEQDSDKNVHIFSENLVGFFKQVSPGNYAYVSSSLFQLRQSFNNDLLRVSRNVSSGVVVNANEGFIHYSPNLEERVTLEKPPLISEIRSVTEDSAYYRRLPFAEASATTIPLSFTTGTKVLQFKVESFKFRDVSNQQFRYFLTGFDEDYGHWNNSSLKEYTNLKEGDYQFSVQTLSALGDVTTSQAAIIKVSPPFYWSLTARILYAALGFFMLYQIYRFQRQYYKNRQRKLEQSKQQELSKKQNELQEMKEEQIKSELRHVNNQLAASTMNLVVKNEFMEKVKEEIRQMRMSDDREERQRSMDRIIKDIDTTLKVQEDWKQFEYHFDRVHGDFLSRFTDEFLDLTPGEQKLCAFLRLKMDSKEIANLMGISLRGIEVARYRLRKKLGLDPRQNLSKFILEY